MSLGLSDWLFADVLDHHEGRFSVITLEDRNLPAIAGKRILTPINDDAKRAMDDEFARTAQVREEVMNTLADAELEQRDFRKLYPLALPLWKLWWRFPPCSSVSARRLR